MRLSPIPWTMRMSLLLLMTASAAAAGAPPGPVLELDQIQIDLGLVSPNTQKRFDLSIANRGSEALIIHSITTDCGCLIATKQARDLTLIPGQRLQLSFSLGIDARMRGLITKRILLATNDPRHRHTVASVSFTVKPKYQLAVLPARIKLGTLKPGTELTRQLVLVSPYPKPLKIESATASAEWIRVTPSRQNGRGDAIGFTVQIRVPADAGNIDRAITIVTDVGQVVVPVEGRVAGRLQIEPAPLVLPPIQSAEPFTASLRLWAQASEPFQVLSITARDGTISDIIDTPAAPGAPRTVQFRYRPAHKQGSGSDRLNIATDTLGIATAELFYFTTGK